MFVTTIARTAINLSLRVARLPLDVANRVLGRPGLEVDAVDAAVRERAGAALGDTAMQQEGTRRRVATDRRVQAQDLRSRADAVSRQADEEAEARKTQAEEQRRQADKAAQQRKRAADKAKADRERRAAEQAAERKQAADREQAERRQAADAAAKRTRLEALDESAEALKEREDALVAEEEAARLKAAAGRAKAARKSA